MPDLRFHIAHAYRAPVLEGIAGGDFFAYEHYHDGTLYAILGDVSAKRAEGLSLANFLVKAFRYVASRCSQPSTILRALNAMLITAIGEERRGECFATALVCRFSPQTRSLRYAAAGTNGPLIVERSASCRQGPCGETLLGLALDANYEDVTLPFATDHTLVAFTDGVPKSRHAYRPRQHIGGELVADAVERSLRKHARATCNQIFAELAFHNGGLYRDDATLFVAAAALAEAEVR
jgi:serine phosphatase RsbU (regulator of sigma subunit)